MIFAIVNATLVLNDRLVEDGSVLVEDGVIRALNPFSIEPAVKVFDAKGAYLMPGMVDLHCDAIEKVIEPRPNVHFPVDYSIAQIDRMNAMAGITTPFHAVSFAGSELGVRNIGMAASLVRALRGGNGRMLVDNRVHCRYEVTDEKSVDTLIACIDDDIVDIISFMDHTPGQGQFKDYEAYRDFRANSFNQTHKEIEEYVAVKMRSRETAFDRMAILAKHAIDANVILASHDDDTPVKVDFVKDLGVAISEFPINLETARAARKQGVITVVGAPNALRGTSQSGSMRAIDAVQNNAADCLCSDYAPATLMPAIFTVAQGADLPLEQVVAMVSSTPAKIAGLTDRGEIRAGKRADLVLVMNIGGQPQVIATWVVGRQVFYAEYHQAIH